MESAQCLITSSGLMISNAGQEWNRLAEELLIHVDLSGDSREDQPAGMTYMLTGLSGIPAPPPDPRMICAVHRWHRPPLGSASPPTVAPPTSSRRSSPPAGRAGSPTAHLSNFDGDPEPGDIRNRRRTPAPQRVLPRKRRQRQFGRMSQRWPTWTGKTRPRPRADALGVLAKGQFIDVGGANPCLNALLTALSTLIAAPSTATSHGRPPVRVERADAAAPRSTASQHQPRVRGWLP
jgi:hypothetical protein